MKELSGDPSMYWEAWNATFKRDSGIQTEVGQACMPLGLKEKGRERGSNATFLEEWATSRRIALHSWLREGPREESRAHQQEETTFVVI